MSRRTLTGLLACVALWGGAALGQGYQPYQTDHGDAQPTVAYCLASNGKAVPCGGDAPLLTLTAPFERNGKAFALPVTTTPQTYAIVQPSGSTAYRGSNPCPVDVVITSVSVTAPMTTQSVTMGGKTIPNVLLVTSATASVNEFEDTYFLARSGRVLSSSANPMAGSVRYVSIMALADPGAAPCAFRLHYGKGN